MQRSQAVAVTARRLRSMRPSWAAPTLLSGRAVAFIDDTVRAAPAGTAVSKRTTTARATRIWRDDRVEPLSPTGGLAQDVRLLRVEHATGRLHSVMGDEIVIDTAGAPAAVTAPGFVEDLRPAPDGPIALIAEPGADLSVLAGARALGDDGDPDVRRPDRGRRRLFAVGTGIWHPADRSLDGLTTWSFAAVGVDAVIAVCSTDFSESGWYGADLYQADAAGRRLLYRTDWQLGDPVPDAAGRRIAVVEGWASDRGFVAGAVRVIDRRSGTVLTIEPPGVDVATVAWRDEHTLWFSGWRGSSGVAGWFSTDGELGWLLDTDGGLHSVDLRPGTDPGWHVVATRQHRDGTAALVAAADGDRRWKTLVAAGKPGPAAEGVAHAAPDPDRSPPSAVTPHLGVAPRVDRIDWSAADDTLIQGLTVAREPGARRPLIVHLHGGPANLWSAATTLDLLLAACGYTVLMPNPRGSVGRGQTFSRANLADPGGAELDDIVAGVAALTADGSVDPARVGVTGGSYGGYLTACAVATTAVFAAGVVVSGHPDLLSARHGSNNPGFYDRLLATSPYGDGAMAYLRRSPIARVSPATSPTLVLHGREDRCTPIGQGEAFHRALLDVGVPTELVVYPREGHSLREPAHLIDSWERTIAWFDRHLGPAHGPGTPGEQMS